MRQRDRHWDADKTHQNERNARIRTGPDKERAEHDEHRTVGGVQAVGKEPEPSTHAGLERLQKQTQPVLAGMRFETCPGARHQQACERQAAQGVLQPLKAGGSAVDVRVRPDPFHADISDHGAETRDGRTSLAGERRSAPNDDDGSCHADREQTDEPRTGVQQFAAWREQALRNKSERKRNNDQDRCPASPPDREKHQRKQEVDVPLG